MSSHVGLYRALPYAFPTTRCVTAYERTQSYPTIYAYSYGDNTKFQCTVRVYILVMPYRDKDLRKRLECKQLMCLLTHFVVAMRILHKNQVRQFSQISRKSRNRLITLYGIHRRNTTLTRCSCFTNKTQSLC